MNLEDDYSGGDFDVLDDNDDYYSSEAMDSGDFNDNVSDHNFDGFSGTKRQKKNYSVLTEKDIHQRQEDDITRISTVLSISRDAACMVLRRYSWSVNNVHEAWFADEDRVRKDVGLLPEIKPPAPGVAGVLPGEVDCGICFETYPVDHEIKTGCGHQFCSTCWAAYISTSINDGPGCLALRCPAPSCRVAVGLEMVTMLASDEDQAKYRRYLLRSYIEDSPKIKWCPAPGCECAIEYDDVGSTGNYDVSCLCSNSFCWNCTEEVHRPADCDTVSKWIVKNSAESENTNWILAYTKPCPECKRSIEKNEGCMHMTCRPPCRFQFCWLCLRPWSGHVDYACNRYKPANYDESEQRREMAKQHIQRYTHYFERWATNESSRAKALSDLHQIDLAKLGEKLCQTVPQLEFILKAWLQIVECRRVLKWTYAYGYYLQDAKREFFEYLQGEAEAGLERLHQCAEKELQTWSHQFAEKELQTGHLKEKGAVSPGEFNNFRTKLIGLTGVTCNYFENLVTALENGLSDVGLHSKTTSSKSEAGGTSKKAKRGKGKGSTSNKMLIKEYM